MSDLPTDIATLKNDVRRLPTKSWFAIALAGMIAAMAAIVAVIVRFLPHAA